MRQSIIMSTIEILKTNQREDLCKQFIDEITKIIHANNTEVTLEDNLIEESMEVDDEQDDRYKKSLRITEYNDVDYRFFDQDMDHRMPANQSDSTTNHRTTIIDNDSDFRTNDVKIQPPR